MTRRIERDTCYRTAIAAEGAKTTVGGATAEPRSAPPETADIAPIDDLETVEERAVRLATRDRLLTEGSARYIVVQPGDSLGSLARDIDSDMLQFRRIYEANRDKITDPNVIREGTRLLIP